MLMVAYRAEARVIANLQKAIVATEATHEVAVLLRQPRDLLGLRHDAELATVVVLDLRTLDIHTAVTVSTDTLHTNAFAKVVVVAALQPKLQEQCRLYELGRAGVASLPSPDQAEQAWWWTQFIESHITFDIVAAAHQDLAALMPSGERGEFLLRVAQLAHLPSIKSLSDRLYPGDSYSMSYKRRRLWEACRRLHLGTPEAVLAATRLMLIKFILDADQWTLNRVARYFGVDTSRNFNRSCKTRYSLSVKDIRRMPRDSIVAKATEMFVSNAPWSVLLQEP